MLANLLPANLRSFSSTPSPAALSGVFTPCTSSWPTPDGKRQLTYTGMQGHHGMLLRTHWTSSDSAKHNHADLLHTP